MSFLEKITDFIGIEKFLSSIEELFSFYFKPFSYYESFFKKSLREKIVQVIIYSILLILIGYITIDNITFRELTKVVIAEIALTFLIAVVLVISDYIVSKIEKRDPQSENVVFFVILAKLLISPFQVVFFGLFVKYENYNFFFIANLIFFFQYIYVLIFSARVFNKKLKFILLTILINIVVL